jgi:hypothetical protein
MLLQAAFGNHFALALAALGNSQVIFDAAFCISFHQQDLSLKMPAV